MQQAHLRPLAHGWRNGFLLRIGGQAPKQLGQGWFGHGAESFALGNYASAVPFAEEPVTVILSSLQQDFDRHFGRSRRRAPSGEEDNGGDQ